MVIAISTTSSLVGTLFVFAVLTIYTLLLDGANWLSYIFGHVCSWRNLIPETAATLFIVLGTRNYDRHTSWGILY